jgi:signal transduction histidine kinase
MHPVLLIPVFACALAALIAAAILARDPGQRANRLIAMVLLSSAWWSLCEVVWNLQDDPELVLWLIKLSSLGWLWLGAFALHVFTELHGDARSRLRRLVPAAYATAAVAILLYVATPWCLSEAVRTPWGWGYRFGPLFPVTYAATMGFVVLALVNWPRLFSAANRERRQAKWMFVGMALPCGVSSLTDVMLPYLGVQVPRLGSASLLVMGCVVGWSLRRHGHFLLAPDSFAREILETLGDGVVLLHPSGRIRFCNGGLARLAEREREALHDVPLSELLPGLPGAAGELLQDVEIELHTRSGQRVPVSVSSIPLQGDRGETAGHVWVVRDLREVTDLRNRLVTAGRLAAVGELAAGIAHEIANPIAFVRANLGELRSHWTELGTAVEKRGGDEHLVGLSEEGRDLIDECAEGVERVAAIVRDVGAFAHVGRGKSERVNVNQVMDNAVGIAVLSFSVVVERCYADVPDVACDPQQLKQVFLNLLLNALQAVEDYGRIRLVTQGRGEWVTIRVEDDGPGIDAEALERIFDPFFTTRASGQGLGLAHSYQIVRSYGGEIVASSQPGEGARFEVRLPVAA